MSRFSSRNSGLLKDGSWIRKDDDEDEDIDRDPNFGKSVLNRTNSNTSAGSQAEDGNTSSTISSSSVQSLSKRFTGGQEDLSSSTTTTITNGGKSTETTTTTTTTTLKSPGLKSPTMSDVFSERVKSTSQVAYSPTRTTRVSETTTPATDKYADDILLASSIKDEIPHSDSVNGDKYTTTTRTSSSAENELYDVLLPEGIKSSLSTPARDNSITKREVYTVESGRGGGFSPSSSIRSTSYKTYDSDITTTRTTSYSVSSTPGSDDYSSERKSYSYSRPDSSSDDYSSSERRSYSYTRPDSSDDLSSSYTKQDDEDDYSSDRKSLSYTRPDNGYNGSSSYTSSTTTYRSSSRSDDSDPIYSKSSTTNVYSSSKGSVSEKDQCTVCYKPFTGDAKIVLDDMKINCHATCFKCQVCSNTLDHLKAGDSMWIYKSKVHCDNCFEITREKWRR